MTIKGLFAAAAGVALMTTGTATAAPAANPAASLSIAPRAASASLHGSRIGASVPTTTLISIGILAAIVVVVVVVADNNNSNSAKSP